jgi:hypothetical protein
MVFDSPIIYYLLQILFRYTLEIEKGYINITKDEIPVGLWSILPC